MPKAKDKSAKLSNLANIEATPRRDQLPQDERVTKIIEEQREKMSFRMKKIKSESDEQSQQWAEDQQ